MSRREPGLVREGGYLVAAIFLLVVLPVTALVHDALPGPGLLACTTCTGMAFALAGVARHLPPRARPVVERVWAGLAVAWFAALVVTLLLTDDVVGDGPRLMATRADSRRIGWIVLAVGVIGGLRAAWSSYDEQRWRGWRERRGR